MSLDEVLKCGSNFEMSPPWAMTSSFFWVVWAWAAPGQRLGQRPGDAEGRRALEQFASSDLHGMHLREGIEHVWR